MAEEQTDEQRHLADWLKLVREISTLAPAEEEWALAGDSTLLEEFDPWECIRVTRDKKLAAINSFLKALED